MFKILESDIPYSQAAINGIKKYDERKERLMELENKLLEIDCMMRSLTRCNETPVSGKHWAKRKNDKDYWQYLILNALRVNKIPKQPLDMAVTANFKWNDGLDIDNHTYMGKMIIDALVGHVLVNDNRKWLKGVSHEFHNENWLEIEIKRYEGE